MMKTTTTATLALPYALAAASQLQKNWLKARVKSKARSSCIKQTTKKRNKNNLNV